jgi:hypothetical protein
MRMLRLFEPHNRSPCKVCTRLDYDHHTGQIARSVANCLPFGIFSDLHVVKNAVAAGGREVSSVVGFGSFATPRERHFDRSSLKPETPPPTKNGAPIAWLDVAREAGLQVIATYSLGPSFVVAPLAILDHQSNREPPQFNVNDELKLIMRHRVTLGSSNELKLT